MTDVQEQELAIENPDDTSPIIGEITQLPEFPEYPEEPEDPIAIYAKGQRQWRNIELVLVDYAYNKAQDMNEDATAIVDYRIALRNFPQCEDFPHCDRPVRPAGVFSE